MQVNLEKILTDFPNVKSMLDELSIEPQTFQCIKKNKSGIFNPKKGEKSYRAFQVLERRGYVSREIA